MTLIFSFELLFLICKLNLSHIFFSPEFSQSVVIAYLFYTLWNGVQTRLFLGWKLTISDLYRQSCYLVSISFHFWPYFKNDPFVSDPFANSNFAALNQMACESFPLQSQTSKRPLTHSSSIRSLTVSRSRSSMTLPSWSLRNVGGDAEWQRSLVVQSGFVLESLSPAVFA